MKAVCISFKPMSFRGARYFKMRYMREDNTIGEQDYTVSGAQQLKAQNGLDSYAEIRGKEFSCTVLDGRFNTLIRRVRMILGLKAK